MSRGNLSRSWRSCPGCPPRFRFFPPLAGGFFGLTMSLDGGFDEVDEFLRASVNCWRSRAFSSSSSDTPIVLVKWYDWTKWLLERVDSFPKNQRFIFGQRLADRSIRVLEILVEASYCSHKVVMLAEANRQVEVLRWLVRLAKDRKLLTVRQYGFACKGLTECGRMIGGWLKQASAKEQSTDAPPRAPF